MTGSKIIRSIGHKIDRRMFSTQEKLFPTIHLHWKSYQDKMLTKLKELGRKVVIAGDGRHDSMGHCAKFGAYTVFCCTLPLIIHFSLVQVLNVMTVW